MTHRPPEPAPWQPLPPSSGLPPGPPPPAPQQPWAGAPPSTPGRRRRVWPWLVGGLALLVLLAGAVVALVLTRDGDSSPYDLPAAIDEGADVAWSAELPEGGSTFGAFVVDGVTIVPLTIAGPGDSDSDEGVVVAYDNGGDEAWRVDLPTRYGSAFGVEDHGLVLVQLDDGMSALRARNGEEQWHVDGVRPDRRARRGGGRRRPRPARRPRRRPAAPGRRRR